VSHVIEPTVVEVPEDSISGPPEFKRTIRVTRVPRGWYLVALALLFLMALGTRAIGLGGAVTEDEDQWIWRSGTFARGLAEHDWLRTYLTGHPGVTVMWLTTLTLGIEPARAFDHPVGGTDVTVIPGFLPALDRARVPFAVLQAGLVVLATALTARLLGPTMGLIAGLLFVAEPFWAGVGPIVGMDGLLTSFLTVSLLAFLLGAGFGIEPAPGLRGRIGWGALAGLAFGLAFLSKTTVLLAGPVFPVVALLAGWYARRDQQTSRPLTRWWAVPLVLLAACGLVAALSVWLIWPAAWDTPIETVLRAFTFSARLGAEPHGPGNFLLGQTSEDPGPLFYPVALMVRIGPGTTIGLMLLFLFGAPLATRRVVWALLGYVALFLILLTLASKKVDRYLLPILPSLGVLAAIGWVEAARYLHVWWTKRKGSLTPPVGAERGEQRGAMNCAPTDVNVLVAPMALLAFALQLWPLVQAGRYPLAGYNPLVGGVRAAERSIPVGWGDGLDVAGEQIREMAGGRTVVTSIWSPLRVSFGAHAPGPVVSDRQIGEADFFVDYVHARQRRLTPRQLVNRTPDAVVTIGGVDYARVYRLK
jgi:hypothetical protein